MRGIKNILLEGTMYRFKQALFAAITRNRVVTLILLSPLTAAAQEGTSSLEGSVDQAPQHAALAEARTTRVVAEVSLARLRSLKPDSEIQAAAPGVAQVTSRVSAAKALGTQSLESWIRAPILALEKDAEIPRAELMRWLDADADRPLAGIPTDHRLGPSRSR